METSISPPDDGSISQKIIDAVAEAEGDDPRNVTPPLYDVVDPDALDKLFDPASGAGPINGRVTFAYSGHVVTVSENGEVLVRPETVH